jgi:hypothetical protein
MYGSLSQTEPQGTSHRPERGLHSHAYVKENRTEVKSSVFWDITPYIAVKVNRRFRGTFYLKFQARRINQTRNQRESRLQA